MMIEKNRRGERGGVLVLILVAVSLFGALSFTVAQMMRSGDPESVGDRKAGLIANEILALSDQYRKAIQTLRISNGCEAEDISFEDNALTGYNHTPAASDDCKLFHTDGGGMSYLSPSPDWLDSGQSARPGYGELYFTGRTCVVDVGLGGVNCNAAADDEDLLMVVPYVQREVCEQINNRVNVDNVNDNPPQEAGDTINLAGLKFDGVYGDFYQLDKAEFRGKLNGCFEGAGALPHAGTYHFYQVLIAR